MYQRSLLPLANSPAAVQSQAALFTADDLVSSYSRAQAIDDGVLRDASELAREAGIRYPVALTAAAWADCVAWDRTDPGAPPQDETGRLWDVVYLLSFAIRRSRGGDRIAFAVLRVPNEGRGRKARHVRLEAVCGPGDDGEPVITVGLPGED